VSPESYAVRALLRYPVLPWWLGCTYLGLYLGWSSRRLATATLSKSVDPNKTCEFDPRAIRMHL